MQLDHFKAMYLEDVAIIADMGCPACKTKSFSYDPVTPTTIQCEQPNCRFAVVLSKNYGQRHNATWFVFGFKWHGTYTYYKGFRQWIVQLPSLTQLTLSEPEDQEIETLLTKVEKLLLLD